MTILYIHHFCHYFQFFCSSRRFFEDKLYAEALDPEMRVPPAELSDFDGGNLRYEMKKNARKIWEGMADDGGIFE